MNVRRPLSYLGSPTSSPINEPVLSKSDRLICEISSVPGQVKIFRCPITKLGAIGDSPYYFLSELRDNDLRAPLEAKSRA
jgi:hypothetical protein